MRAKETHKELMASTTLNASPLKTNSIPKTPTLTTLNKTKPIISLTKATPSHLDLRHVAVKTLSASKSHDKSPVNPVTESPLTIAIVGFGNFGQFITKGLRRQGHVVLATSRSDYSDYCKLHGIYFFRSIEEMCEEQPDIVLVSSSILSTETVVRAIPLHKLRPETVFVDVLSVKQFPRNLFLEVLPPEFGIVCTHPMFGPESGKHGWNGLPFVYESVRISEGVQARRCAQFLSIFEEEGCKMMEMSCEEHDRHAAGSQFITHTIGRILSHLDLESTPINTKGYETLLQLRENTVSDSFDLYYGLFMYNVNATEQIDNLDRAFETVKQKLFGRLHDLLRKQIVERVPMPGTETRMKEAKNTSYFLQQNEEMKDLSSFAIPAPSQQQERRAHEVRHERTTTVDNNLQ